MKLNVLRKVFFRRMLLIVRIFRDGLACSAMYRGADTGKVNQVLSPDFLEAVKHTLW